MNGWWRVGLVVQDRMCLWSMVLEFNVALMSWKVIWRDGMPILIDPTDVASNDGHRLSSLPL